MTLFFTKTVELQQEVEVRGGSVAPAPVRIVGRLLGAGFVEIQHAVRRVQAGHRRRLQNFVIKRDGQFFLAQARADEETELAAKNPRLSTGLALQSVQQRFVGELNFFDDEPSAKPKGCELPGVYHRWKLSVSPKDFQLICIPAPGFPDAPLADLRR